MAVIKDHYIRALEYAASKSEFTLQELVADLGLTDLQREQLALQIHEKQIFQQNHSDFIKYYGNCEIKLHFSVEDKFRLLNFVALEEARNSSKSATRFAGVALGISIITLVISTCFSWVQMKSNVSLPSEFVQRIDDIKKNTMKSNVFLSKMAEASAVMHVTQESNTPKKE